MVTRTLGDLARDLKQRRELGDPPPVILLGAGAMTDLFVFVQYADFNEFVRTIDPLTPAERYRLLARFLQSREPAEPTSGYRALAALCADAYFDLILTTNLDPLLDDASAHARLWRRDYLLVVNGAVHPERVDPVLTAGSQRVKEVKLHGDLFHRSSSRENEVAAGMDVLARAGRSGFLASGGDGTLTPPMARSYNFFVIKGEIELSLGFLVRESSCRRCALMSSSIGDSG